MLLLAGEAQQWETYEYMRDAVDQGRNKAIIFLGHINSEEAGMDYCSLWLKSFIKNVPVYFVECGLLLVILKQTKGLKTKRLGTGNIKLNN